MAEDIVCLVIGNASVGKTCLILSYVTGAVPKNVNMIAYEVYSKHTIVDEREISLKIWDTSGDEFDQMRSSFFHLAKVFLLCFSIESRNSFDAIKTKWSKEVDERCPETPIVLVGTKRDLKRDETKAAKLKLRKKRFVSLKDGFNLAQQIGAAKYLECSIHEPESVKHVFEECVRVALNPSKLHKQNTSCSLF